MVLPWCHSPCVRQCTIEGGGEGSASRDSIFSSGHEAARMGLGGDRRDGRFLVTTVDVGIGGEGISVDLSNGLFGAASNVLFAAQAAYRDGRASGYADAGGCDVWVSGTVLREMLEDLDISGGYSQQSSVEEFVAFCEAIRDDGRYHISAVEC